MSVVLLGGGGVLLLCSFTSSAAGAGAYFGGFIPGTLKWFMNKLEKDVTSIISNGAKEDDCKKVRKLLIDYEGLMVQNRDAFEDRFSEKELKVMAIIKKLRLHSCDDTNDIDSILTSVQNVNNLKEDEDPKDICNEIKENTRFLYGNYLYWDDSKEELMKLEDYIDSKLNVEDGSEVIESVGKKCEAVGINLR